MLHPWAGLSTKRRGKGQAWPGQATHRSTPHRATGPGPGAARGERTAATKETRCKQSTATRQLVAWTGPIRAHPDPPGPARTLPTRPDPTWPPSTVHTRLQLNAAARALSLCPCPWAGCSRARASRQSEDRQPTVQECLALPNVTALAWAPRPPLASRAGRLYLYSRPTYLWFAV